MKPRSTKELRNLSQEDLLQMISNNQETLAKQKFQHSLKQLHDVAYLRIMKRDIARMKTVLNEMK